MPIPRRTNFRSSRPSTEGAAASHPSSSAGDHAVAEHRLERAPRRNRSISFGLATLLGLSAVAAIAVAGAETAAAANQTSALKPSAMSFTNASSVNTNYSRSPELLFSKSQYRTYLKYDTSTIKAKSTIVSAELELSVTRSMATKPGIEVRTTGTGWAATTLTYASKPTTNATVVNAGSTAIPRANTKVITKLTGLAGKPVASVMSMQLAYSLAGTQVNLSKTAPPVLRLVTAPPVVIAPTPTPTPTPTKAPTTAAPTTAAPTPSAAAPTTVAPTTAAPTTVAPTTAAPTTAAPTTAAPTTVAPTTAAPTTAAPTTAAPPAVNSDQRPYTNPGVSATEKKVFAHYFPPYPISLDNQPTATDYYARNYLNPAGEGGKFQAVGGLLRDRPLGRPVLAGNYKLTDAETEVRQAVDAGVEGFLTDIMSFSARSWTGSLDLSVAAANSGTGFVVAPNVDMTSSIKDSTPTTMAYYLAQFYKTPGAYRLADGRYMLSTFKAEAKPATYWSAVISELKTKHNVDVAFVGILLSINDAQVAEYAPISYALGVWGGRDASLVMRMANRAAQVQKLGVKWMSPIAVQDVRHTQLKYAESNNTELLRASWSRAISDGADFAQLITWNDYSESTGFSPSASHRNAFLDVNGYYANQFKTGTKPTLHGDELVVTHRIQKVTTKPLIQTSVMASTLAGSSTAPRDTVEVMSILKAPATVTLTVGATTKTVEAPAGVSQFTLPLATGTISAAATRSGQSVAAVTSPHKVVSSIDYWNLQYYAASSRENPTR